MGVSLKDILQHGGIVIYPLIAISFLSLTVVIYKILALKKFAKSLHIIDAQIKRLILEETNLEKVKTYILSLSSVSSSSNNLIIKSYQTVVEESQKRNQKNCEDSLALLLEEIIINFKRNMWIVASTATTSPFVGLLGTVLGIMKSFLSMSRTGQSGFTVVAQGLAEALVTTALGIFISVVALIFYNYITALRVEIMGSYKISLERLYKNFAKEA